MSKREEPGSRAARPRRSPNAAEAPLAGAVAAQEPVTAAKTALLVVGMHRSGTSAITRVLSLLGADLPVHLLAPVEGDNDAGFWESLEIHRLNEEVLASAGSAWDDVTAFSEDWYASQEAATFRAKLLEILHDNFADSSLFVIKDPRIARLLPFWRSVLQEFGADPRHVLIFRNPLEVAASLEARNGFVPAKSHLLWLWHLIEAEKQTRGSRRSLVLYPELMADWRKVARRIGADLDLRWPPRTSDTERQIEEFLSPELWHQRATARHLEERGDVVEWVKRAYAVMVEAAAGGGEAVAEALDEIRGELAKAELAFGPLVAATRDRRAQPDLRQAEATEGHPLGDELLRCRVEELEAVLARETDHLQAVVAGLRGRMWEVAVRDREIGRLTAAVHARSRESRELAEALAEARAEAADRGRLLAGERTTRDRLAGELSRAQAELLDLRQDHAELEARTAAMVSSRSWKITRPFRHLVAVTRNLLRRDDESSAEGPQRLGSWRHLMNETGAAALFDTDHYLAQLDDPAEAGSDPVLHYLARGAAEGRNPHPLFSTSFYLASNADLQDSELNPLLHYFLFGAAEGRDPHPLFNTFFYVKGNPGLAEEGINPLAHYVSRTPCKGGGPNPLFDDRFYLECNPEVVEAGENPLWHYISRGAAAGLDPHPLFDTSHYLGLNPEGMGAGENPLWHYISSGAAAGADPHPLFDTSYYLECNPEVAEAGENPLWHYLSRGSAAGLKPHPLFDGAYYLKCNPEVAEEGENALWHYLQRGAAAGSDPHPLFDSRFYTANNPDVAKGGLNPLVHYVVSGGREGRDPHPSFDTSFYLRLHPELLAADESPLQHYVRQSKARPASPSKAQPPAPEAPIRFSVRDFGASGKVTGPPSGAARTVVCVTHVPLHPPRAGNEYRIYRMLRHLSDRGYRVVLVLAPLPGEKIDERQFAEIRRRFPYSMLCGRDGRLELDLGEWGWRVAQLDGVPVESPAVRLGEERVPKGRELELLHMDRTYCHDPLVQATTRLLEAIGPCVVLAQYVFMARLLPLVDDSCLKVIDTHDVFSTKQEKVVQLGVTDCFVMTSEEERRRLLRGDVVVAIQREEQKTLAALVPERRVIRTPVDFEVRRQAGAARGQTIFCLGSNNPMNVKGVVDFLRWAWPRVARELPDAELQVAGRVCEAVRIRHERVRLLGLVDDLDAAYGRARLVINPSAAGTGLKIKTLEALAHIRPIVTWPSGVDGLEPELAELCLVAEDWYEFGERVIEALRSSREGLSARQQQLVRDRLSPAAVYEELIGELERFFSGRRR